jgi:hypothetical protein
MAAGRIEPRIDVTIDRRGVQNSIAGHVVTQYDSYECGAHNAARTSSSWIIQAVLSDLSLFGILLPVLRGGWGDAHQQEHRDRRAYRRSIPGMTPPPASWSASTRWEAGRRARFGS